MSMTLWTEVQDSDRYVKVLDHGFVGLVDVMGDDAAIVQAARTSYGKGTKSVNEDRGLIRYLIKNFHTSPIEMVEFKFHIKLPIFVMRQHVRHRTATLNEYSGRYSVMTDEFYIPDLSRMQTQSSINKQGSEGHLVGQELEMVNNTIRRVSADAYADYLSLVNEPGGRPYNIEDRQGLSRELARIILPVNNYTECYWKIDLKNLFHYIKLRADHHAQWEIQEFARALAAFVKQICPVAFEAFEDYWEQSETLSRMDVNLLTTLIDMSASLNQSVTQAYQQLQSQLGGADAVRIQYGLSKREMREFEQKWRLNS
jgi:thymidylate synthase (FAD)